MNSKPEARPADFLVEWADGKITRPLVLGTFDLSSGRVLSLNIAPNEKELVA